MLDIQVLASGSTGNCYRLDDGSSFPLLLESGIPYREIQNKLNFTVSSLAGCLVSHEHGDHAKAVKDMLRAGIDCYMSQGTADALGIDSQEVRIIRENKQFSIGTWTILPLALVHDAREPLGFLLGGKKGHKVLYLTDTAYSKYLFNGLTHIMVECNYALDIIKANVKKGIIPVSLKNRIIRNHFRLDHVKDFLRANDLSNVEEIWLIHLSNDNSDEARFKREIQELTGLPVHVAERGG